MLVFAWLCVTTAAMNQGNKQFFLYTFVQVCEELYVMRHTCTCIYLYDPFAFFCVHYSRMYTPLSSTGFFAWSVFDCVVHLLLVASDMYAVCVLSFVFVLFIF